MKKLLFLVFIFSLFSFQGCKQAANPITLQVTVSDSVCQSSQWVYWFSVLGNEYNIVDSCYLAKGQHSFTMKKVIPDMSVNMWCWLTFTKHGPTQAYLFLSKGEKVKLIINKKGFTKTVGSLETKEVYSYNRKAVQIRKKIDSLTGILKTTKNSLDQTYLSDRISSLQDSLDFKMRLENFKNLKTPKIFLLQLLIANKYLSRKTIDSLVKVMKQRFPDNKIVQEYPRWPKYPPATQHGKLVHRRLLQIWTKRTGISYKRPTPAKLSIEQKKALSQIEPLKLGERVDSLSFKGLNGKIIALKEIRTPYVLIDFWASWCTPCREEVPDLKLAQAKYKGQLTIYSVSLDENKSNWRSAIRVDKSDMLIQVLADTSEFVRKKITKLFWIKFIPRNFLLDQHRKIIAINIPGDSLETKLGKLCR